jgi:hypothetical protein
MMALAAIFSMCAVASSWMFIRNEPSPSMSMTCLSGRRPWRRGGRVTEAHRAQAGAGEELARVLVPVELGGPHLVLAHAGGDDGFAAGQFVEHSTTICGRMTWSFAPM